MGLFDFLGLGGSKNISNAESIDKILNKFCFLNLETTGLITSEDRIIKICLLKFRGSGVSNITACDIITTSLRPEGRKILPIAGRSKDLKNKEFENKPFFKDELDAFISFIGDCRIVSYRADFDKDILSQEFKRAGQEMNYNFIDAKEIVKKILPDFTNYSLDNICKRCDIEKNSVHDTEGDTVALYQLFVNYGLYKKL